MSVLFDFISNLARSHNVILYFLTLFLLLSFFISSTLLFHCYHNFLLSHLLHIRPFSFTSVFLPSRLVYFLCLILAIPFRFFLSFSTFSSILITIASCLIYLCYAASLLFVLLFAFFVYFPCLILVIPPYSFYSSLPALPFYSFYHYFLPRFPPIRLLSFFF